jgi:hypothetical protein
MTKWIARNKRNNKRFSWKKYLIWLAVPVAVFLIVVLFGDTIAEKITSLIAGTNKRPAAHTIRPPVNIDSLLYSVIVDLGLDTTQLVKGYGSINNDRRKAFPRYQTKWPDAYPLIWFTHRLQIACRARDSLHYDAIEMENGQKLLAVLLNSRDTVGRIELVSDNRYKPAAITAAVVFDNFGVLSKSQVTALTKMGIPFGYILAPDQALDKDLGKILKTCRGECLLRLPTDKGSWATIVKKLHLGNLGKSARPSDKNFESIFKRFPVIDGFFFDDNNGVDKGIVKSLLAQTSKLNLFYFDDSRTSGTIDSVLAESGIKIGIPFKKVDLKGPSMPDFSARFKTDFGVAAIRPKIIYIVESRPEYIEALDNLTDFRAKWNIKMAPPSAQLDYSPGL